MPDAIKVVRSIVAVIIFIMYALLVHHVNTSGRASLLAAALALIPIAILVLTFAVKSQYKSFAIALVALFSLMVWWLMPIIKQHIALIFWLQDLGLMLILLFTFARTLQPGRKPLCVYFAEMINGGALPVAHECYARKVTMAWVMFFAGMILISSLLFFLAPLATWSFFVNFLILPLVALMFIGEYVVRRNVLVDLPAGSALDAVRAYLNNSREQL